MTAPRTEPVIGEELWVHVMPGGTPIARRIRREGQPYLAAVEGEKGRRQVVAVREVGTGASHVAPVRELTAAAPLGPGERREFERLDSKLAGTHGDRRLLEPYFALAKRALIYGELEPAQ